MNKPKDPTIFQIAHSILASFFGVQTRENHERDDAYVEKKGLTPYILMGFAFVIVFHVVLFVIVKIVMANIN